MSKATTKLHFNLIALSTLLFLIGCSSPEEKRANQENKAKAHVARGEFDAALIILEELAIQYPNDSRLLASIGDIYKETGDVSMSAFFLEQASLQEPESLEIQLKAYFAAIAANQPSINKLIRISENFPEEMSSDLWIKLGHFYAGENQTEKALRTFLRGVDLEERLPSAETATAVGQLFSNAGILSQAEQWFQAAVTQDDPNALPALFGLLDLQLRQKRWEEAETTVGILDKRFPGAIDASQWKHAKSELVQWREAQDKMRAQLSKVSAQRDTRESPTSVSNAIPSKPEIANKPRPSDTLEAASDVEVPQTELEGKAQILSELDTAEAMADLPAIEPAKDAPMDVLTVPQEVITYNPSILVQPADPDLSVSVTFDQEALAPETRFSVSSTPSDGAEINLQEKPDEEDNKTRPTLSFEELMADAETAEIDRNFKTAIQKYLEAIGISKDRPDVWNRLARAYLVDGQLSNAETAALEAIKIEPNAVNYTLDYLRVAQRSRPPEEFLSQLETAYDRFPANPELTLSLARAHERVSKQKFTARNLYQRFIALAPNHPLVQEARDAIQRLR